MAEDRVASVGSLGHDNESAREGCRTKEPPDPEATRERQWVYEIYRHRDASRNKLAPPIPAESSSLQWRVKQRSTFHVRIMDVLVIDYVGRGKTITGVYYAELIQELCNVVNEKRRGRLWQEVLLHFSKHIHCRPWPLSSTATLCSQVTRHIIFISSVHSLQHVICRML